MNGTPSGIDLNYAYPTKSNNGQIASVASGLDGSFNANYTYDSLNRLTGVSGAKTQSYSYDGWGNLYSRTGDGNNFTVSIGAGSNRPYGSGICYDPNGNLVSTVQQCAPEYGYDIQNHLVRVAVSSNGSTDATGHLDSSAEVYYYTADGKRVSTFRPNGNTAQLFYLYGAKNELAAICTSQPAGQAPSCATTDLKFAGRVIRQNRLPVTTD